MRKIRFGVMCDGSSLCAWEAECIKRLMAMENVSLELLILPGAVSNEHAKPVKRSRRLSQILHGRQLWKRYSKGLVKRLSATKMVDMKEAFVDVDRLTCDVVKYDRFSRRFSAKDTDAIKALDLDFILRFAFGIVRGDILDAARFGLWSFHHGDEREYRGSPAGFWEIVDKQATTGAILQRLTNKLDGGYVLHRGFFEAGQRYEKSLDALLWGCVDWPARLASQLRNGDDIPEERSETSAAIRRAPTNWQFLRYAARIFFGRLLKKARQSLFEYREIWNVGLIDRPIQSLLAEPALDGNTLWMDFVSRNRFAADPFGREDEDGRIHVLFEDYDYRKNRGVISAATADEHGKWRVTESVIAVADHLSYPYLLEHDDVVYCVPESVSRGETLLLRAEHYPDQWSEQAILMPDVGLVDPTVFHHDGLWWIFAGKQLDCDTRIDCLKLFGWYAQSLDGPWHPHSLNPLKTDCRSARPGGTPFTENHKLYRPAQDCSETYGGKIRFMQITALSPTLFSEQEAQIVRPPAEWSDGIHTVSSVGSRTLIDAKKKVYVFRGWRSALRRMVS